MSEKITVKAQMTVKESPELSKVQHKAVAGLSAEELIERNTIGKLKSTDGDTTDTQERT